ncbi:MAG: hypothetical protein NVSMB21_17870 [Vulcanimicrobiaceae bacterium]
MAVARSCAVATGLATLASGVAPPAAYAAATPTVMHVATIPPDVAARLLRGLFPHDRITVDREASALVVVAPAADTAAIERVLVGIDVRGPGQATVEAIALHASTPAIVAAKLGRVYPHARFLEAPNDTLVVRATASELAEIKPIVAAIDTPAQRPSRLFAGSDTMRVVRGNPRQIARAVARRSPGVSVALSGGSLVLTGQPDDLARAKALVSALDVPRADVAYPQVYRMRFADPGAVATLLTRSFAGVRATADQTLHALTIVANAARQQRAAETIAALDVAQAGDVAGGDVGVTSGLAVEIVSLVAAVPGVNGSVSSSASDIATAITSALQSAAPDLHVSVPANSTQLILTGSPASIALAKKVVSALDVAQKLVVLDTQILEIDETVAKNLGLSTSNPISTTYSETTPGVGPAGGTPPPLLGLQAFTRTPISIGVTLNTLIQRGNARIIANPRITTISGRTATIRSGDNIAILTTTGGGPGTIATTQLQTFQTGVTLDITPIIDAGNFVSVTLHPTVNSLTGVTGGIPQISTRDTLTTVAMQEDQTLVIGGLIQDSTQRLESKIPILGDLPLVGRIFRNQSLNHSRNELVITVTPHIVRPGTSPVLPDISLPVPLQPQPLPTVPPPQALPSISAPVSLPVPSPSYGPGGARGTESRRANNVPAGLSRNATAGANGSLFPPVGSMTRGAQATPDAFAAANVFTYGAPPINSFAGPSDPVQIFYATFSPTVVRAGSPVRIAAITTTNVTKVSIGYQNASTAVAATAPGQWLTTYAFPAAGLTPGQRVASTLTATRADGTTTSIHIPISVEPS